MLPAITRTLLKVQDIKPGCTVYAFNLFVFHAAGTTMAKNSTMDTNLECLDTARLRKAPRQGIWRNTNRYTLVRTILILKG